MFLSYSVSQSVPGSDGGSVPGDDVCGPDRQRWAPETHPQWRPRLKYNKTKNKNIIIKYLTT